MPDCCCPRLSARDCATSVASSEEPCTSAFHESHVLGFQQCVLLTGYAHTVAGFMDNTLPSAISHQKSPVPGTLGVGGRGGAMMRLACVCSTGSSALLGRAAPPTGTPRPLKAPKNTYAHAISSTTDGFTRCTAAAPRGSSLQGNKHVLRARGHRNPACFALSRTSFALAIKMELSSQSATEKRDKLQDRQIGSGILRCSMRF